jgi:hypothetical protein
MKRFLLLALAILTMAAGAGAISLTDYGDHQVAQRTDALGHPGGTSARVFVLGSVSNPSDLYAKVILDSTSATVINWTKIKSGPTDGAFVCTLTVPLGGWYRMMLHTATDTVSGTNLWGVGDIWAIAGQSNAAGIDTNKHPARDTATNKLVGMFEYTAGVWSRCIDPTNGLYAGASMGPALGSKLADYFKFPIGIVNCGSSGGSLTGPTPASAWGLRNPLNHFDNNYLYSKTLLYRIALANYKSIFYDDASHKFRAMVWLQGEGDADESAANAYKAKFDTLMRYVHEDCDTNIPVFIVQISHTLYQAASDTGWSMMRDNLYQLDNDSNRIFAGCSFDLPLIPDSLHLTYNAQDSLGEKRVINAITNYYDGTRYVYPKITSIAYEGPKQIAINFNKPITSQTNFTGFQIYRSDTAGVVLDQKVNAAGTKLVLTTDFATHKNLSVRYMYGSNPTITYPIYATDGMPVLPQSTFLTMAGSGSAYLGRLPLDGLDYAFLPAVWYHGDGKSDKNNGYFPVYPGPRPGASQPDTLVGMAADGDRYTGGTLSLSQANHGYVLTSKIMTLSDASSFTWIINGKVRATNYWNIYCGAYSHEGIYVIWIASNKLLQWYFRIGGTLKIAAQGTVDCGAAGTPYSIALVKRDTLCKAYLNGEEITYGYNESYTLGTYAFSAATPIKFGGDATYGYSDQDLRAFLTYDRALSEADLDSLADTSSTFRLIGTASADSLTMALSTTASSGGNGGMVGGLAGAFAAAAYLTRKWWTRAFR